MARPDSTKVVMARSKQNTNSVFFHFRALYKICLLYTSGELKVQNEHEMLGEIIKNARIKADITVEDLAAKVGVGERFIYRIENEGKKPSYDILYKLIRELSILPDQIFFPEKQIEDSEMESLVRMLYNCDERSMQIIKATVRAALDSQPKE